jgi:hypothetical protein
MPQPLKNKGNKFVFATPTLVTADLKLGSLYRNIKKNKATQFGGTLWYSDFLNTKDNTELIQKELV